MDEDALSPLVLHHLTNVLQLAVAAVNLVETPEADTLTQLRQITTIQEELEVGTVMLLLQAGVPWATMAAYSGPVTRQSLHRRMSRKVAARIKVPPQKTDRPGLQTEWSRLLQSLTAKIQELRAVEPNRLSSRVARSLLAQDPGPRTTDSESL